MLIRAPRATVPFLRDRIVRTPPADLERVEGLIRRLDDQDFRVRRRAAKDLAALGEAVRTALRHFSRQAISDEHRKQIGIVAEHLTDAVPGGEHLRGLRSVEVLQAIGTEQARAALEELAKGSRLDPVSDRARLALQHLRKVPTSGKRP